MLDVIMHDILGTPAILVGLFAFIGLLIQKIKFHCSVRYIKNDNGLRHPRSRGHCLDWLLRSF